MTHYIITGSSSGIGKALAKKALTKNNSVVSGISRTNDWEAPGFTHHVLDLNHLKDVISFSLPHQPADEVILINNAGYLGDIKRVGNASDEALARVFNVNISAVAIMMNKFLNTDYAPGAKKTVLNVSSGAGSYVIPAWASYCASKAAVDMLSKTVKAELDETGNNARILSVGPGVVDTPMQGEIRGAAAEDFSRVEEFKTFKTNNELASPDEIAEKYFYVLENNLFADEVVGSLRDVTM